MPARPRAHPSPNFGERRGGARPALIVIHYTALASAEAALARLTAPEHEVSAHYLVARDGALYQLVDEDKRAWHAGAGSWGGQGDVNSRSIGIELDNSGFAPFAAPLMDRLEALISDILARHELGPEDVIGHQDMAPARKLDPGPRFDWRRLARAGLAVWPAPEGTAPAPAPDAAAFRAAAIRFGYPAEAGPAALLAAFRARFRPGAEGPLAPADMAAIADLAARFPVDPAPASA
jgi:N-acetylmuramoyl-L-alanine amidase